MIEFKLHKVDGLNRVYWMRASEINNSHFDLKRSSDRYSWEYIATF